MARNNAKALRVALRDEVWPEHLPSYIRKKGGLKEMLKAEREYEKVPRSEREKSEASSLSDDSVQQVQAAKAAAPSIIKGIEEENEAKDAKARMRKINRLKKLAAECRYILLRPCPGSRDKLLKNGGSKNFLLRVRTREEDGWLDIALLGVEVS